MVAPITTTARRLSTEVPLGRANGLDSDGVIHCDDIAMVLASSLERQIGYLLPDQETALAAAVRAAFDLA